MGNKLITYIDDMSRKVVGKGKLDNATTDNALLILDKPIEELGKLKQVMADHGTLLCAKEERSTGFRGELRKGGIEYIMSAVEMPQSNRKIDRWFRSMKRLCKWFKYDLDKFVECYDNMPHLSLDTTQNIAYL